MPKRKAAQSKISGLVDGDDDDLIGAGDDAPQQDPDPSPRPTKRTKGQQKPAAVATTTAANAKRGPRKRRSTVVVGPKKQAARGTGKAARKSNDGDPNEPSASIAGKSPEKYDDVGERPQGTHHGASEDELGSPETLHPSNKKAGRSQEQGEVDRGSGNQVSTDGEFEYTPGRPARGRPPTKTRGRGRGGKKTTAQRQEGSARTDRGDSWAVENEEPAEDKETELPGPNGHPSPAPPSSPLKSQLNGQTQPKLRAAQDQKRKSVRIEEPAENDAALRRKLGDMAKRYESLETKYRNLREVAVVEANANAEKLRKQCQATTTASNELVTSLKQELAMQSNLAQRSRALQKQLDERDAEVSRLQSKLEEMSSGLTNAQSEAKALQTKLAASRNSAAAAEGNQGKGAGVAKGASARNAAVGGGEVAQLKEDLYSDLTGLIVRDVKKQDTQQLYDCIQTGLNGTLHFKLAVSDDTASYEEAEFHYTPFLDANRDRELIDILPEYLSVDITFSRQNAAKFYSRVVDTLTKKHVER